MEHPTSDLYTSKAMKSPPRSLSLALPTSDLYTSKTIESPPSSLSQVLSPKFSLSHIPTQRPLHLQSNGKPSKVSMSSSLSLAFPPSDLYTSKAIESPPISLFEVLSPMQSHPVTSTLLRPCKALKGFSPKFSFHCIPTLWPTPPSHERPPSSLYLAFPPFDLYTSEAMESPPMMLWGRFRPKSVRIMLNFSLLLS